MAHSSTVATIATPDDPKVEQTDLDRAVARVRASTPALSRHKRERLGQILASCP